MTLFERNLLDIMRYIPENRLGFKPTEQDAIGIALLSGLSGSEGFDEFDENVRKITEAIKKWRAKK